MRRSFLTAGALGTALTMAGCGADGGTGPTGTAALTAAEVAALNQAILGVSSSVRARHGPGASLAPADGADAGSGAVQIEFSETEPCQAGGFVGVDGTMDFAWDQASQTGDLGAEFSVAHTGCVHPVESGEVIVVSGDPDIDVHMQASSGPDGISAMSIAQTGAFTWEKADGSSGRCTLAVAADLDPASGAVEVSGTFCGVDVSGTFHED